MPDVQIRAAGPSAAPLDYVVPGAHEIDITMLSAHFDGTSAGVSWLPCVEILSDGGTSCGIIPMDAPVAAGASVEATWGPFLRSTPAAAAAGTAWASLGAVGATVTATGGGGKAPFDGSHSAGDFYTSNPAVFAYALNTTFNKWGIQILGAGHFMAYGWFYVRTFGAGAIDLTISIDDGPQQWSTGPMVGMSEVLSSTPIYGDQNSNVTLTWIGGVQVTTGSGNLPANPMVWFVNNEGANFATLGMYGYSLVQLDTADVFIP